MEPQVLIVTSAGAPAAAVVPVLAAIEAAGMRVRAIDVGAAGGGGVSVADRVRRALLGEGAERRLRKELEASPPDATVVFDPYAALALTVARDQVANPAPVIGVVGELEPAAAWAETDADRFVAVDELAAVALADAGVEGERILVVGAIGERAFADAGHEDRQALRARFKLGGKVALVEVAGLGPELTGQLALQLSLLDGGDTITWLFDAAGDVESAAVLRRQVPSLGLRAKLFGVTTDSALLWRAADIIVGRPRHEVVARTLLVGGKLVALVDDNIAGSARAAAALESRKRAVAAKGLLLLSAALDSAFAGSLPPPTGDGGDNIADIVAAVAADKRGVIDERRAAAHAQTRERVRAASAAASAVAQSAAMPGELEDLGGSNAPPMPADLPDAAELSRLRTEVQRRMVEMSRSMTTARDTADKLAAAAAAARLRDPTDASGEAVQLDRRADAERAKMHAMLAELSTLDAELKELERASKAAADAARTTAAAQAAAVRAAANPPPANFRTGTVDDQLSELKRRAGGPIPPSQTPPPAPSGKPSNNNPRASAAKRTTLDDDLAALKQKMSEKKKP